MSQAKPKETMYLTVVLGPKKETDLVLSDENQEIVEIVSVKNGKVEIRQPTH